MNGYELNVKTNAGVIRGVYENGVCSWKGIPYAHPPRGERRFLRSVPAVPWDGVLVASSFGNTAPQKRLHPEGMSEDCLFLNIWSPSADGGRRPVLFYIHGGSFSSGAGSEPVCSGVKLAREGDVVVVTVNYRLGVLGFLDFSAYGAGFESNCGYSDILCALKWTYENICAFGGDNENITVLGQSAGAIAISALVTSEASRRYISKAVMMSSGPTLMHTKEDALDLADKFLDFTGILPEELKTIPCGKLLEFQKTFISYCNLGSGTFTIQVDGDMVKRFPIPAAAESFEKNIPVLMGNTKEEMAFLFIKPVAKALEIDGILNEGVAKEPEDIRRMIPLLYTRYGRRGRSMMVTDLVFRLASTWFAEVYSLKNDTWMYSFDYETFAMKISGLHAFHSSDIPFLFGNFKAGLAKLMFVFTPVKKRARYISRIMQADLFGFMRSGVLPWNRCHGADTPAKCYDKTISYRQMIAPDIKKAYLTSEYRKRSFEEYYDEFCHY